MNALKSELSTRGPKDASVPGISFWSGGRNDADRFFFS